MAGEEKNKEMMKALLYEAHGGLDQLKIANRPVPEPSGDEVLIHIRAAALNPIDWKLLGGNYKGKPLPHVVGYDCSGIIKKVGKNVKKFKPGDEVFADTLNTSKGGTFAEYCATHQETVAKKPPKISFEEASVLGFAPFTAHLCLEYAQVKKGTSILILGGTGSIGSSAIQIAKSLGARHIATTCDADGIDLVKKLGANVVIDYQKDHWADVLKDKEYEVIFDAIGEEGSLSHASKVLKKGGTYIDITVDQGFSTANFNYKYINTIATPGGRHLTAISDLVESGQFQPIIEKVYDFNLDQIKEMFKRSMSRKAKGKLVVSISKH